MISTESHVMRYPLSSLKTAAHVMKYLAQESLADNSEKADWYFYGLVFWLEATKPLNVVREDWRSL
jgi:hypothetical protein